MKSLADLVSSAEDTKSRRSTKLAWTEEEDKKLMEAIDAAVAAGKRKASFIDQMDEAKYIDGRTKTELWRRSIELSKRRIAAENAKEEAK